MKLISCYITGFGAIKEYSYEFAQGFDAICQENGWGKTTFSVFLKAMFYGMDYSSRSKVLTERKHYLPWDGSTCGGNVVFEISGKIYRVERSFGKTDKEDTFALIDPLTGLESKDFSENLGEEIFQVDRESFEKSIFIPQTALTTAMTDSLNAKMGNLSAAKDDINHFDQAVNKISETKKNYTRKSKVNNGKMNIIKEEISACNEIIDRKTAVLDGYYKQSDLLEEKRKSLNWMEAEKNRVAEQIRLQSKKEQDMGAYRQKVEFLTKQQEELTRLDDFFANGVPTAEEQSAMEDVERQYDLSQRTEKELAEQMPLPQHVQKLEKLFAEGVPSGEDIEEWNAKSVQIQELMLQGKHAKLSEETAKQLEDLKFFFSKKLPSEEELTEIEKDVVELSKIEGRLTELDEQYRTLRVKKEVIAEETKGHAGVGLIVVLFVFFVILFLGGWAFRLLTPEGSTNTIMQIVCFGGAVGTIVAGFMQIVRIRSAKKNRKLDMEHQYVNAEQALAQCEEDRDHLAQLIGDFLAQFLLTPSGSMQQMVYEIRVNLEKYKHLQEEEEKATITSTGAVEELADVQMALYTALATYAEVYEMDLYHENKEALLLEQLQKDKLAYQEYRLRIEKQQEIRASKEQQKKLLDGFLGRFPFEDDFSDADRLQVLRVNREHYLQLQEEVAKLAEEIKEFQSQNQVQEDMVSVEELQQQQEKLDQEIKDMNQGITQDMETLQQLSDELESIDDAESRRDVLNEEYAECEKTVKLLTRTEEFLQKAKEQFLAVYMQPLRDGMDHYMQMLDASYKNEAQYMDFDITMDLTVQVSYQGQTHTSDYLSRGYQDLVSLCARFALVDVLYRKEQPMIILDDPFTNFDAEKIERALKLLQEVAKERQVIYYTCHESRMP